MEKDFFYLEQECMRLDLALALKYPECSRNYLQQLIEEGSVLVSGKLEKKGAKIKKGSAIAIRFTTKSAFFEKEYIPLNILFEDEEILIINKPAHLVVHPGPGHFTGTLLNGLLYYLESAGNVERCGLVHRLDKETSGLMVVAKTAYAHAHITKQFAERLVKKRYHGICLGVPKTEWIKDPIGRDPIHRKQMCVLNEGGKEALSHVKTLKTDGKISFVKVDIYTGRTHQIRVHLQKRKCPLLGDSVYGYKAHNEKRKAERVLLHASILSFIHPKSGKRISFRAALPADIEKFKNSLA